MQDSFPGLRPVPVRLLQRGASSASCTIRMADRIAHGEAHLSAREGVPARALARPPE